ncbi:MAG: PQQ-binding-like beta-propeller repeat protein [Sedimentisphaerales bacterium]|nr:PQQ-binding-like beta-propeller repeat protein [Sedimentisphaerales bacterium]
MSTRAAIWVVFVTALILALIVFFVARGMMKRAARAPAGTGDASSSTLVHSPAVGGDWPMFHGEQSLRGVAPGTLADSLSLLWKFKTEAEVKSSAAVSEGRVFIGSADKNVYALDFQSGRKLWSYPTGDSVEAAPCVLDGRVFVGSGDNCLYALDAGTGELKWKYETEGQILGAANWTRSPDGQQTWVLVGSYDNMLHCVDAPSGKRVWAYETGNYVNGSPAVDRGRCAFGGCDAIIHVVSLADGSKLSEIDSGSYIAASAAFLDDQIYVGNYENVFFKVDVKTATVVWKYSQSDAPFFSSPAVADELVVFGGRDDHVHCVRRDDGRQVWTFKTLGEVNSSPAVCGDKVVVGSDDGRLYMLRLADGKRLWSYEIGQPVTSSPAVAGGRIVVGCDDGYVYAFGPKPAEGSNAP